MQSHLWRSSLFLASAVALLTAACSDTSEGAGDAIAAASSDTGDVVEPSSATDGTTASGLAWTTLGTFDYSDIRRVYVLVPSGLSDAELVEIVDDLRARAEADPANDGIAFVAHWLMDDDTQFETLLRELPRTREGDSSGWPVDYVTEHTVAVSDGYITPDGDGGAGRVYWLCRFLEDCDADLALAAYPA